MQKASPLLHFLAHHSISVYLFAFLIPLYPKWLGFGVLFILLEHLIKRKSFRKISSYKNVLTFKNAGVWLFLYYLMHVVGMVYSENISFGSMDLGMKASFAIFPVFFFLFQPKFKFSILYKSFIIGAITSIVLCFYLSYLDYLEIKGYWHFQESYLSHFMHRSYWATYLVLAFIFSVYLVLKKQIKIVPGLILALIFFIVVFITGSKAGIILVLISTISILIYFARVYNRMKWTLLFGVLAVLILSTTLHYFPSVKNRIERSYRYATGELTIKADKTESTASRLQVWESALQLIEEKPFLGYGTGDVKDELKQKYIENEYLGVAEKNMNAHNQFLNSWVALGLFGFVFLLISFLVPFVFPSSDSSFVQRLTIFVLFASLLVESFLETQAGIIPIAFLLSIYSLAQFRGKGRTSRS